MKEYDQVEVIVEKEEYAKEGVHKGMIGQILDPRCIEESWLVYFEDPITFGDEIGIPIKEKDLKLVWEAPVRQVGRKIMLLSDEEKYTKYGLTKGMKGEIIEKMDKDENWLIRFELKNKKNIEALVNNDDFALLYD